MFVFLPLLHFGWEKHNIVHVVFFQRLALSSHLHICVNQHLNLNLYLQKFTFRPETAKMFYWRYASSVVFIPRSQNWNRRPPSQMRQLSLMKIKVMYFVTNISYVICVTTVSFLSKLRCIIRSHSYMSADTYLLFTFFLRSEERDSQRWTSYCWWQ